MFELIWKQRNYYELLEIPRDADLATVKRAYRFQLLAWHPDKFGDAEFKQAAHERTVSVNEACEELSDPSRRALYDLSLPNEPNAIPQFDQKPLNDPITWKKMAAWMKANEVGAGFNRKLAYDIGRYLQNKWQLSPKQKEYALKTWDLAKSKGFEKDPEEDSDSDLPF